MEHLQIGSKDLRALILRAGKIKRSPSDPDRARICAELHYRIGSVYRWQSGRFARYADAELQRYIEDAGLNAEATVTRFREYAETINYVFAEFAIASAIAKFARAHNLCRTRPAKIVRSGIVWECTICRRTGLDLKKMIKMHERC